MKNELDYYKKELLEAKTKEKLGAISKIDSIYQLTAGKNINLKELEEYLDQAFHNARTSPPQNQSSKNEDISQQLKNIIESIMVVLNNSF